jgi:hypothetical protein
MARTLRDLPKQLQDIDLVIEARDARLPLTSVNGAFDTVLERAWGRSATAGMIGVEEYLMSRDGGGAGSSSWGGGWVDRKGKGREKVVVYTKRDLAERKYEEVSRVAPLGSTSVAERV